VKTHRFLRAHGYTGPIYILIDDEDDAADEYYDLYEDTVIQFDKKRVATQIDECDNFTNRRASTYGHNVAFSIAKQLNIAHFVLLDDDYSRFDYVFDSAYRYGLWPIKNLDSVFDALVSFQKATKCHTIAFAQTGDYMGGSKSGYASKLTLTRKAMNTFVCSTDTPIVFPGRMNEDVSAYVTHGSRGALFFTTTQLLISQADTQMNAGGMTDLYRATGTYVKSCYTLIQHPSSITIKPLGYTHPRLHHAISWNNTVPKIIRSVHRKELT
jgi:hypothetical protein